MWIITLNSPLSRLERDSVIIPILEMRKLSLREIK